jgi:hypothetical protein
VRALLAHLAGVAEDSTGGGFFPEADRAWCDPAAAVACVQAASGYRLARQELTFAGLCPACAAR